MPTIGNATAPTTTGMRRPRARAAKPIPPSNNQADHHALAARTKGSSRRDQFGSTSTARLASLSIDARYRRSQSLSGSDTSTCCTPRELIERTSALHTAAFSCCAASHRMLVEATPRPRAERG